MAGSIYGVPASFPIGGRVPSTDGSYAELQKQLGNEVMGPNGKAYRLVQAATALAATTRAKALTYTDASAFTVQLAGATKVPCGVGLLAQESLAAGDLHWVQISGQVTLTDSGSAISKNDLLDTAATGDVVAQATPVLGQTFALAQAAASANAQFTAELLYRLVGEGDA